VAQETICIYAGLMLPSAYSALPTAIETTYDPMVLSATLYTAKNISLLLILLAFFDIMFPYKQLLFDVLSVVTLLYQIWTLFVFFFSLSQIKNL